MRLSIRILVILVIWGMTAIATAQQSGDGDSADTSAQDIPSAKDQLLALIANEVVIAPGVGLRNIRLGERLSEVTSRLGPPQSVSEVGILRRKKIYIYQLDSDVVVGIEGRSFVEQISVAGGPGSLVRTMEGARFGMKPAVILRIYRSPSKVRKNRIRFASMGADFYFSNNQLARIEVYTPRR